MNVNKIPSSGGPGLSGSPNPGVQADPSTASRVVPSTSDVTNTLNQLSASGEPVYERPQGWQPSAALAASLWLPRAAHAATKLAWWLLQVDAGPRTSTLRALVERAQPGAKRLQLPPEAIQQLSPLLQNDTFVRMTSQMSENAPRYEFVLRTRPDGGFYDLIPISNRRPPMNDTSDAAVIELVISSAVSGARGTGNRFVQFPTPSLADVAKSAGVKPTQARYFHSNPQHASPHARHAMPGALVKNRYEEQFAARQNLALMATARAAPRPVKNEPLEPLSDANGGASHAAMALIADLAQTPGYFNTRTGDLIAEFVHKGAAAWFDVDVRVDSVTPAGERYRLEFPALSPERPAIWLKCEGSHYNFRRGEQWIDVPADGDCQFRALYEALQDTGDAQIRASLPPDPQRAVSALRQAAGNYIRQASNALREHVDPAALGLETERQKLRDESAPPAKRLKPSAAGNP